MNSVDNPFCGMSEETLHDFVNKFPEGAHIKDIQTKKYLYSNKNVYGVNDSQKIIGLTVYDLDHLRDLNHLMQPYWLSDKVSEIDECVIKEGKLIIDTERILLNSSGLIRVRNMTKVPIVNPFSHKVTAILTISFEVTPQLNKLTLFDLYKKIYVHKREACLYLMHHLKIKDFFVDILSEKEMICLLYMLKNRSYKYIAEKMALSVRTVETHINHINLKLKSDNLTAILTFLSG